MILRQHIQVHLDPQITFVFLLRGERRRYKDPWTHQKNQTKDGYKTHSMTDGDSNEARLVGPPHQTQVNRPSHGGTHLSAPLHRPRGPSRRLRVAPPHKVAGRPTYDMGPLKVGYTPPTLARCANDLGCPSKAVSMTVYPKVALQEIRVCMTTANCHAKASFSHKKHGMTKTNASRQSSYNDPHIMYLVTIL